MQKIISIIRLAIFASISIIPISQSRLLVPPFPYSSQYPHRLSNWKIASMTIRGSGGGISFPDNFHFPNEDSSYPFDKDVEKKIEKFLSQKERRATWVEREIYPGRQNIKEDARSELLVVQPKCHKFQTYFKGKCFDVLSSIPCDNGEWLVEDKESGLAKCVRKQCPQKRFLTLAWMDSVKKCVPVNSQDNCPQGMKAVLDRSGEATCDCHDGFIYNVKDGQCYEAYRQGPCASGEYFALIPNKNTPSCMRNPCGTDGYVCPQNSCKTNNDKQDQNEEKGISEIYAKLLDNTCQKLGTSCEGNGVLRLDTSSMRPKCQKPQMLLKSSGRPISRIIGNVPTLKCAPGSKRDILGYCRTPTEIEFS